MDKQERRQAAAEYKKKLQTGGVYAILCRETGKRLLIGTTDMPGSENRFAFAQSTGGCVHPKLRADWDRYGAKAFAFETVETLKQKETQSDAEFKRDIDALLDMVTSKYDAEALY